MLLDFNAQQKQYIPSFQSIQFKLSQNCPSSRNQTPDLDNFYEPGSLTFTQTQADFKNSLRYIELPEDDKQNFNNIQFQVCNKQKQQFEGFKKVSNYEKPNIANMKRKKSLLSINTIQLLPNQTIEKTQEESKRSKISVNFKGIQRRNSVSRNRINSVRNSINPFELDHQSILGKNSSSIKTSQIESTEPSSIIRKKSLSSMKTQDKSMISSIVRTISKEKLQRCKSVRDSRNKQLCFRLQSAKSDRQVKKNEVKVCIKHNNIEMKVKYQRKKQFLEDPVPLQNIINVKSIKLEENTDISKAYLRKIIQNRVSIQHYAQGSKYYCQLRQ